MKVAIIQEILAHFRLPLFEELSRYVDLHVFYGTPPRFKRRKNANISGIESFQSTICRTFEFPVVSITIHPSVLKALWLNKIDTIVVEPRLGSFTCWAAICMGKLIGTRIVVWTSEYYPAGRRSIHGCRRCLRKLLYAGADASICYSRKAKASLQEMGIRKPIYVAYNTVDSKSVFEAECAVLSNPKEWSEFQRRWCPKDEKVVLYVGRLEPYKEVNTLLLAFKELQRILNKPLKLLIIGSGSRLTQLQEMIHLEGIKNVHFVGPVYERKTITQFFLLGDVFVLPGTGGLALSEAVLYGKPVVVSSGDGIEADIVQDGVNGFFFEQGQFMDLTQKIKMILSNDSIRHRMAKASRKIGEEFLDMELMRREFLYALFS